MVDRCVCHDVTFAQLRALSQLSGADLPALALRTGCGTGCGCCIPYIRLMLRTGQTDFPVLTPSDFRRLEASAPTEPETTSARPWP